MNISAYLKPVATSLLYLIGTFAIDVSHADDSIGASQVVGVWSVSLVDNIMPDGSRVHLYGPNPQGLLIFDKDGRYSLQIFREERVKFASNDKSKGTADEIKAAIEGCNTHFGTYSVDQDKHTITFRIEHASFPNWDGTVQVRHFNLVGEKLTYVVANPTIDRSATGEVEWHRMQ